MKLFLLLLLLPFVNSLFAQNKLHDTTVTIVSKGLNDTTLASKKDTVPYATLYFYRSYVPPAKASLNKASIYINDSLVYKLKYNTLISMRVLKQGRYSFSVDKKGETEISVAIKLGKEYFFKCEAKQGLVFGHPTIDLVTPAIGKADSGLFKED